MPILYVVPLLLKAAVTSGQASVVGAIIKDNVTGRILGHMQQTTGLQKLLGNILGPLTSTGGFSPLSALSILQNEQIKGGIARLEDGIMLLQNLQYGTLALSGLGLGVSVAGFAATLARLNAIEKQLDRLSSEIGQVTLDRREDDLKDILAQIGADLQNVDTLTARRDPARAAEQLQISLSRASRRIEVHFLRTADVSTLRSIPLGRLEQLWALAGVMRLCQETAIRALFVAEELELAQRIGQIEIERQFQVMNQLGPDMLSRLVSRREADPARAQASRQIALDQARRLRDGIKGGVLALAGQVSLAETLQLEGGSGLELLKKADEPTDVPMLFISRNQTKT